VIIYLIEQKQKWDWRVSLQLILLQSMKKFTLVVTSITFESKHIKKLLDKVFLPPIKVSLLLLIPKKLVR
jgi:hypothetical protein